MKNGLLDPVIIGFVFTPLALTVALLLAIWRRHMRNRRATFAPILVNDTPRKLLASAVAEMPEERRDWGAAMLAELGQIQGRASRWWFALSCARVALFPPHCAGLLQPARASQNPVCGILAITLPPLGLPILYLATVIVEAIGGSPFTQASRWSNPDLMIAAANLSVKLIFLCLLAGLPLGLAGWLRRERLRWLSMVGMLLSASLIGYFLIVMSFLAGGPNAD